MKINFKYQKGMTLMELLIAGSISIVVSAGMIVLMASTMGTTTRTIKMTGLSDEMRASMQLITRELRRANYHSTYARCFGDVDCRNTLGLTSVLNTVTIAGSPAGSCVYFWYDRPQAIDATSLEIDAEQVAAFRRTTTDGVGFIEMSVSGTTAPSCSGTSSNWQPITNPAVYDVTNFVVNNDESFVLAINGAGANLTVERISVTLTGSLLTDPSLPTWLTGVDAPALTLQDFVRVRNDISNPL